jgi:2,3-bisphosphoglycerate-independent phosphoglycerate mutase
MKYVMVIYEAAADKPLGALNGRTPLEVARCPQAAFVAEKGAAGLVSPISEGLDGRNEVCLAGFLGVEADAALDLQRGPVEGAALVDEADESFSFAYCGSFVTLDGDRLSDGRVGSLSVSETETLCGVLQDGFEHERFRFVTTGSARIVVFCHAADADRMPGYPPCFHEGERANDYLPPTRKGADEGLLREMLRRSGELLSRQTLNDVRLDLGENPANAVWLWGGGPLRKSVRAMAGRELKGCMISNSAMARGLARLAGMNVVQPPAGEEDDRQEPAFSEDFLRKNLEMCDVLVLYVEAPRKLGQYGTAVEKVRALEALDQSVLAPLMDVMEEQGEYRLLLASDGVVSSENQRPASGSNPFVMTGSGIEPDDVNKWNENAAAAGRYGRVRLTGLFELLTKG